MKKIFKSVLLLACGAFVFAACSDDDSGNEYLFEREATEITVLRECGADADSGAACYQVRYRFPMTRENFTGVYIWIGDEVVDDTGPLEIFDPYDTWKTKVLTDFKAVPLQVPVFKNGKQVYDLPALAEVRAWCQASLETMWDEVKRFDNPHNYYVDLSRKLWDIKYAMIKEQRHKH